MENGMDSKEFVLLSQVRTGHNPEFAFAMKAQSEIYGSLGPTRSKKTWNEAVATNRSKKLKKSDLKDAENDEVMDQKVKDLGDLGDSMSEEEAKIQNNRPHIYHHQIVETGSGGNDIWPIGKEQEQKEQLRHEMSIEHITTQKAM